MAKRDPFVYITSALILFAVGVLIFLVLRYGAQVRRNTEQIERNRQNIEEQGKPCQEEDIRQPELTQGCNDNEGGAAPSFPQSTGNSSRNVQHPSASKGQNNTQPTPPQPDADLPLIPEPLEDLVGL